MAKVILFKSLVEKAAPGSIVETVSASGKVQPEVEVKLSAEVSGEVVELHVKEGDVVKKGQLLCKVRPDVLQSGYDRAVASLNSQRAALAGSQQSLKQAEANFANTSAKYKRSQELFAKKVISAAEFDAAKAEYEAARANLGAVRQNVVGSRFGVEQSNAVVQEAGANLAKTTIYAPTDGVISKLSVELGDRILGTSQMAGTEIMRISNLSSMEVSVDVNESDINRVSVGDLAEIEVDAFQNQKFKGEVTEIASSSNVVGTSTDQVTNFTVKSAFCRIRIKNYYVRIALIHLHSALVYLPLSIFRQNNLRESQCQFNQLQLERRRKILKSMLRLVILQHLPELKK